MNFIGRLWSFMFSSRIQEDIDEELRVHLEMLVHDYELSGADHRAARKRAQRRFGSLERTRNECSSVYGLTARPSHGRGNMIQGFMQDVRYAIRNLFRQRAFTLVAVATLVVGIAASTVMFSAVNSTLLNPMPFTDGDRIARVQHRSPSGGMRFSPDPLSINTWRERATSVEDMATWGSESMIIRIGDDPEPIMVSRASVDLFPFLRLTPVIGRLFQAADTVAGQDRVVMLTERHWRQQFNRDHAVLGKTITLNDEPYEIIGVAPRVAEAFFPYPRNSPLDYALFIPGATQQSMAIRLKHGVTIEVVQREFDQIFQQIATQVTTPRGWDIELSRPGITVSENLRVGLWVLMCAVGFVLLVACVNVANMLLVRGVSTSHELALRRSLGAGTGRMIRQLLIESLIITGTSTVLSLWMSLSILDVLRTYAPESLGALQQVRFDAFVLGAAVVVTGVMTVGFALVPLGQIRTLNLTALLSSGRAGHATVTGTRLRNTLVTLEVAMATILFVGAGLMTRTLIHLSRHNPGFQPTNVVTFRLHMPEESYPNTPARDGLVRDVRGRIELVPGIETTAIGSIGGIGTYEGEVQIEGAAEPAAPQIVGINLVSDGFFETLGMRVRGRGFAEAEITDKVSDVLVVNETFERVYFQGESAVGKRIRLRTTEPLLTIVGVVPDVQLSGFTAEREVIQIYQPHHAWDLDIRTYVVRTTVDATNAISLIKAAVWTVDRDLPLHDVEVATDILSDAIARPRFNAWVMTAFAFSGLLLAAVGVYTVVSMAQQHRRQEVGIRVALGANRKDTLRLMLGYGMKPVLVGAMTGIFVAAFLSRFTRTLLFETPPVDPVTYVGVALILVVTAMVASWIPTRRALRVDPVEALRYQ